MEYFFNKSTFYLNFNQQKKSIYNLHNNNKMNAQEQRIHSINKLSQQPKLSLLDTTQGDNVPSFLLKTYQILENPKYQDIISWTRNGEGFIVKKVKEFSDTVLPIYFRHNNYTSFVRQLNMYDFHKTRQQNQQNAFKNFLFKKGQKHLLRQIQRKDYKKNKQSNKQLYGIIEKQRVIEQNNETLYNMKCRDEIMIEFPQNEQMKENILQLKRVRNQLQQKSLKLMCFHENEFDCDEMIMSAIDVLFECGLVLKKIFYRIQVLKTDFELNDRKRLVENMRERSKQVDNDKQQRIYHTVDKSIETKQSLGSFKQQSVATTLFEKIQPTRLSLFNSFRTN